MRKRGGKAEGEKGREGVGETKKTQSKEQRVLPYILRLA